MIESKNEVIAEKDKLLERYAESDLLTKQGMRARPLKSDSRLGFQTDFNSVKRDYFDDRQSRDAQSIGMTRAQRTEENAKHSVEINIDFDKPFDSQSV